MFASARIGHQHAGVDAPAESFRRLTQKPVKMGSIPLIAINGAPFVAASGDLMPRSRRFDALPAHVLRLRQPNGLSRLPDL